MMKTGKMAMKQQTTKRRTAPPTNMMTATSINQVIRYKTRTTSMTANDATGTLTQDSESFINFSSL